MRHSYKVIVWRAGRHKGDVRYSGTSPSRAGRVYRYHYNQGHKVALFRDGERAAVRTVDNDGLRAAGLPITRSRPGGGTKRMPSSMENPSADTLLLVGLGVVGAAAVGYAVYTITKPSTPSTTTSNQQATNLSTAVNSGEIANPFAGTSVPASTT
jgi:hypothetical protein